MLLQVFLLVLSIVALYYGAEFALESAEKIGRYFGLSPLVIGLLIVGFGTSLPEFFVSQLATWRGHSPMALGNIVGSNVANLFLILGVSGVMVQLRIVRDAIKRQLILHIALTAILVLTLSQKEFTWWSGLLLLSFFCFYIYRTFVEMHRDRELRHHMDEDEEHEVINIMTVSVLILGFTLLYGGGELLVYSGTNLGVQMGVSSYVISAVFVAFGTSFPELVTAILACVKKKNTDIITGNIIGSNIFNVSFVLTSLYPYKVSFESSYHFEMGLLIFAALFLAVLSYMKKNFTRISGVLFLSIYVGSVCYWISK